MISNDLIFDLGFHYGEDTGYYLAKGFRVVAVEANPVLIQQGAKKFENEVRDGRLVLLNNAVADHAGKICFYIHKSKSEWSSCFKDLAESDGGTAEEVEVHAVTIHDLFDKYGVPRYMKVDIEGCDLGVARQLSTCTSKPEYVSFETNRRDYAGIFAYLYVAGYKDYQLINQMLNYKRVPSINSDEGDAVDYSFNQFSSGLFGEDLPAHKWLQYNEALERYIKYKDLKGLDNEELGLGWLDIHARL